MKKERSIASMTWLTILFILGGIACCTAMKPLPSNLERLALSPSAIGRLQALQP